MKLQSIEISNKKMQNKWRYLFILSFSIQYHSAAAVASLFLSYSYALDWLSNAHAAESRTQPACNTLPTLQFVFCMQKIIASSPCRMYNQRSINVTGWTFLPLVYCLIQSMAVYSMANVFNGQRMKEVARGRLWAWGSGRLKMGGWRGRKFGRRANTPLLQVQIGRY